MPRTHSYSIALEWTGNMGSGTSDYRSYARSHTISAAGKPDLAGSSDPGFRGDRARWNPEELLVAALSACHQLSYLHVCADAGVVVVAYTDRAEGLMIEAEDGSGRFERVVLHPRVTIAAGSNAESARSLHELAHSKCFIANSVNFPVLHEAEILFAPD